MSDEGKDAHRRHVQALEALGNSAQKMMRGMRPKSWEAAASVYIKCVEMLHHFEKELAEQGPAQREPDAAHRLAEAQLPPLGEEELDRIADVLLAAGLKRPKGEGDG